MITVRWESLFADLEAAAEAQERLAFEAELADQVRAERAAITLTDRVRAHLDRSLTCHLVDGQRIEGRVVDAGADWLLLASATVGTDRWLIPVPALEWVAGLSRGTAAPGLLARRLGLSVVLRALAADRAGVLVRLRSGGMLGGTIDRVGADHLDLAIHPDDEPRRAGSVVEVRCVPLATIVLVHSR